MNSKKLLALLCATAMATSTLVPVISASADETAELSATTLWSDSFDGYVSTTVGHKKDKLVLVDGTYTPRSEYAVEGATFYTSDKADDSSYYLTEQVEEGAEGDLALVTSIARFATQARGAYIKFDETFAPTADEMLIVSANMKIDVDDTHTFLPGFKIGDVLVTQDMLGGSGVWADVKVAFSPDGQYVILVNGEQAGSGNSAGNVSSISFNGMNADGTDMGGDGVKGAAHTTQDSGLYGYHTVSLDDLVIYHTADATEATPEAETKNPPNTEVTPEPTEEPKVAAPAVTAPEGATVIFEQNFNDLEDVKYTLGQTSQSEALGDITVNIGARANGGDASTYAAVVGNGEGDKILETASFKYSTAARAVNLTLNKSVATKDLGVDAVAFVSFAARLTPSDYAPATINFLKDTTTTGKTVYANVIATLTTDEAATSGIVVPANEWILVDYCMAADGTAVVMVNGEEHNTGVNHKELPIIATTNLSSDANQPNTMVDFDNFVAYVLGEYTPEPDPTIPPAAPVDGTTVVADQNMNALDPAYSHSLGLEGATYTDIDGLSYTIGGRSEGANDATRVYVKTDSYGDQYLYAQTGQYGTGGRAPIFEAITAPKLEQLATDEDFVGMSFATKLVQNGDSPATLAFTNSKSFNSNGGYYNYIAAEITTGEVAADATNKISVPSDEWFLVDVVVLKTGAYQIFVNGSLIAEGTDLAASGGGSEKEKLTGLPYITINSTKNATNASFAIDNFYAYHTGEVNPLSTPEPTAEPKAAPAVNADAETTVIFKETFNGLETSSTRMGTTSTDVKLGANVTATLGSRDNGGSTGESSSDVQYTTAGVKVNVEGDNVASLTGGKFGTITRTARVTVAAPSAAEVGEGNFVSMKFAFRLNSVNGGSESALTLVANSADLAEDQSMFNSDGDAYKYVLGRITTVAPEGEESNVAVVTADEWHVAQVAVLSDNSWVVLVDDTEVFAGTTVNYTNSDKVSISNLPAIVLGKNVKETVTYPNVDIDNMLVYTSVPPTFANVAITAATATSATITTDVDTTAKIVVASYDADGRMVSAATQTVSLSAEGDNLVAISAAAGDKLMAWDAYNFGGVRPYCDAVVIQ